MGFCYIFNKRSILKCYNYFLYLVQLIISVEYPNNYEIGKLLQIIAKDAIGARIKGASAIGAKGKGAKT